MSRPATTRPRSAYEGALAGRSSWRNGRDPHCVSAVCNIAGVTLSGPPQIPRWLHRFAPLLPPYLAAWITTATCGIGFVEGTVGSIFSLFSSPPPVDQLAGTSDGQALDAHWLFSLTLIGLAVLAVFAVRRMTSSTFHDLGFGQPVGHGAPGTIFGATLAWIAIATAAGDGTPALLSRLGIVGRSAPGAGATGLSTYLGDIPESLAAGITEEILLFALPIALLRIRRWSTAKILAVVVLARVGIHLYYGWGVLLVLPWMIGAYLLYQVTRSIWPAIIGHAIYDLVTFANNRFPTNALPNQIRYLLAAAGAAGLLLVALPTGLKWIKRIVRV